MFRPQPISSTEARKYFSQLINKVQFSSKSFVVQSYRKPAVRIVKEEYIAILEQVLGKKTVGQIMQISGNDNMREHTKAQEIRKILQRRLSGSPRPQPQPRPPVHSASTKVGVERARPAAPKPKPRPSTKGRPTPGRKDDRPLAGKQHSASANAKPLLLQNGKNYK